MIAPMKLSINRTSIALFLWILYTIAYAVCRNAPTLAPATGYLSLLGEGGLDLICFAITCRLIFNTRHSNQFVFIIFGISFFCALLSDVSYNVILNILNKDHFTAAIEAIFDVPFLLFLVLQAIAWCAIVILIQSKNHREMRFSSYVPLLLAGLLILITFIVLPHWRVEYGSVKGIFNIVDTLVEIIAFIFAGIALFASKDRVLGFLASGFLLVIASDFTIRFSEVENSLFPGSPLETTWVLGLIIFALGLMAISEKESFSFSEAISDWSGIKVQVSYWLFVVFLISIIVTFFLNLIFSHINLERNFDIPAMLIVFAVLSTLISNLLSTYLVRPFNHLTKFIAEYSKHHRISIQEKPYRISAIKEFNELALCLSEGLKAIKSKVIKDKVVSDEVLQYANDIRDPVAALRLRVNGLKNMDTTEKNALLAITHEINARTKSLLEKVNTDIRQVDDVAEQSKEAYPVTIVDDNESLNSVWTQEAAKAHIDLRIFKTGKAFRQAAATLDKRAILCLDVHLEKGESIKDLSKWAYEQGFKHIYLITADPQLPESYDWIAGVMDKAKFSIVEIAHASKKS